MPKSEKVVVRVVRGTCADEETCAAVTRVEHDTQWRYLIGEPVSDPAILAAHSERMAPHEVLVRYRRPHPGDRPPVMDAAALRDHIREHFSRTAFRLEALQQYEVASDGSDFARYLAGEAGSTAERKQPWLDRLRRERGRGLHRSCVRLVTHPVTDYTRYECEWGYAPNVEAGEEVLILDAGEAGTTVEDIERLRRCGDFWLIDDAHVVVMHYGPEGRFLGAECAEDEAPYRDIARLAVEPAEPFPAWWGRHEEYHRSPKVE